MINCSRCEGTGFLNYDHVDEELEEYKLLRVKYILQGIDDYVWDIVLEAYEKGEMPEEWATMICDCCGDGTGWYGEPGSHYSSDDESGRNGPYVYNGGLCECH